MPAVPALTRWRSRLTLAVFAAAIFAVAWYSGRKVAGPPSAVIRTYDVRDLLVDPPDFVDVPRLGVTPNSAPATTAPTARSTSAAEIVDLLRARVDPSSWRESPHGIADLKGQLVITQTPAAHAQVQALLHGLRLARAVQVAVEVRFVECDPAALRALPPALRDRFTGGSRAAYGALTNAEFNAFINAANSGPATKTLTFPRVTLINGQRGYALAGTQRAFVSGLASARAATGEVKYTGDVSIASSGVLLDVRATAGGDHQFVTLYLHPEIAELVAMESPAGEAVAPDGTRVTFQRAVVDLSALTTSLVVPNGQTVLASGFESPLPSTAPATRPTASRQRTYLLVKATVIPPKLDPTDRIFPRP